MSLASTLATAATAVAALASPKYELFLVLEDEELKTNPYYDFKVKILSDNANAGFDLLTAETFTDSGPALVSLGVRAMMVRSDTGEPVHFWLAPRSSIYKTGYIMANSLGVIDRTYRGVLKAPVVRCAAQTGEGGVAAGTATGSLNRGDRHFQILAPDMGHIAVVSIVNELNWTARGEAGFGSTGK
jgi:dUTPase